VGANHPPDVAEAAKKLPLGRLYANGRGFVPNIRQSLYSDIVVALGLEPQAPVLPDVPTVGEFLPGYEASVWFGVGAPKATPAEIVDKLNREINAGLTDPKLKARLGELGGTALALSPAEFGKLFAEDTDKWGKVIRAANIKPE
jgi:tripartite-type tricarboxylate transporter receptor subunit TctC